MNAVLSLSHFCETHGPSILFSTQAFHFAGEDLSGVFEPSGIQFFGCLKKLKDHVEGKSGNLNDANCEACESLSGFITNDYGNKISFLSTRLTIDSNVSFLLKQAAVRSLSCEVVPGREGQIYFGDSACGHVLSNTFFLKDAQARGFHRWYSILVFMKDKHFLLNSWPFFQKHISQIVSYLQSKAMQVYTNEQNACSQRAFRLCSLDHNHSFARSLVKLTASEDVFSELHVWFTWLLSTGAKRLEEQLPVRIKEKTVEGNSNLNEEETERKLELSEEDIYYLRQLRQSVGSYNFQRILYSMLIGQQVVVRGPKSIVESIIKLLVLFLPSSKVRCQEFGDSYKTPDQCNIVGLNLCAAVPMSSDSIMRLDIVPSSDEGRTNESELDYNSYKFRVKNECELPEKLPSFLVKLEKALSDDSLTVRVVWLQIKSLMEQWFHIANVIKEVKRHKRALYMVMGLMQSLGVQEQDNKLIEFWTS